MGDRSPGTYKIQGLNNLFVNTCGRVEFCRVKYSSLEYPGE